MYVADTLNRRIQKFSIDKLPSPGITVVSTDTSAWNIFVDDDDDDGLAIYVSLPFSRRAENG